MGEHRRRTRVDCEEECSVFLRDSSYLATIKNISFGGALMHFNDSLPNLHISDKCKVRMNGEFPREYSCKVVRVENPDIAVIINDVVRLDNVTHKL